MISNHLYHTGVKGMKWGQRKDTKRDITKSRYKTTAKVDKKAQKILRKKKNSSNMYGVLTKMSEELESSKIYKDADKFNKKFQQDYKTRGVTVNQMQQAVNHHNKVYKERQRIADKYRDAYAGALLKDMKYENTKAGRDYIKKLATLS